MESTQLFKGSLQEFLSKPIERRGSNDPKYLHKYQDILFYDHVEAISNGKTVCGKDKVQLNLPIIRELIAGLYFFPLPVFEMEDDGSWQQSFDLDTAAKKLTLHMLKLSEQSKSLKWAVKSKSEETYFDFIVNKDERTRIDLYVTRFNEECKVCIFVPITIRYVENDKQYRVLSHTMYLISKRDRDAEYALVNDKFIKNGCSNGYALNFLDKCIKLAMKDDLDDYCDFKKLSYTILEMNVFRLMSKSIDGYIGVHEVIMCIYNHSGEKAIESIESYQDVIPSIEDRSYKYPIVSLSEKEWKFIHKYILKTYPEYCDLRNVLEYPRYGKRMVLKYVNDKYNEDSLVLSDYEYFPDEDKAIFYLSNFEYNNISSFIKITVDKVSKYTGKDNITRYSGYIKYMDGMFNISSLEDLIKCCPTLMFTDENLKEFLIDLISLLIALYDRPERVKCVKSVKKDRSNSSDSSRNSDNRTSKDVIIERVLVASKDVNDYIRTMGGSSKDREYVLESWERRGHYRRIPGTNKSVWIEPTTCSRHLPLTEKEIQIKL